MTLLASKPFFSSKQKFHQILFIVLVLALCFAWNHVSSKERTTTLCVKPVGVMGTSCTICVKVKNHDLPKANQLLKEAEQELRKCEQCTSTWISTSEISRLNQARAGEKIPLSSFTLEFLQKAKEAYQLSNGAFDASCGALWFHWKKCEEENRLPTREELEQLRVQSSWEALELHLPEKEGPSETAFAVKRTDQLAFVTGGLAKGMAIDAALKVLSSSPEVLSAYVEVGGDLAVFQNSVPIEIEDPNRAGNHSSSDSAARIVRLSDGGVCTSGHHARYFSIQGKRFSQILNPADGQPVPKRWTVTVTAPNAATADFWATALEVLGTKGIFLLPEPEMVSAEFISYEDEGAEEL